MKKKASMAGLAGMILVLAVFIILIIYFIKASGTMSGNADRDTCRMSVLAQSLGKEIWSTNLVEPECKTYTIRFYNDHVEKNGKAIDVFDARKKDFVKKFDALSEEIIFNVAAEEYRWCWYQFLEGQKSVFDWNAFFPSGKTTCFVCAEISFDPDVREGLYSSKDFLTYMQDTNMQRSNMTYGAYLSQNLEEGAFEKVFSGFTPSHDKNYYVTFEKIGKNSMAAKKIFGVDVEFLSLSILDSDLMFDFCDVIKRGSVK